MKIRLIFPVLCFLSFAAPSVFAQTVLPYHPYRKVGDRYYDLRPLYSWINAASHVTVAQRYMTVPNPMKDWFGVDRGDPIFVHYSVIQVAEDGLLVREERSSLYNDRVVYGDSFFLKNYPDFKKLTDHQEIRFLALRAGSYRYTNTLGSVKTVPCYDYGVPYDPWALQKAKQTTNFMASTNPPSKKP